MTRLLLAAAAVLTVGCSIAPNDMDVTVELGADKVKYRALFTDVRVIPGGLATSLPAYAPLAESADAMLEDMPWAKGPTSYRWIPRDGGLDLEISGALDRKLFDACARESCQGGVRDGPCENFVVKSCDGGYEVMELKLREAPKTVRTFKPDAGTFRYRAGLTEKVAEEGVTAATVHAVWAKNPKAAKDATAWINALSDAFEKGELDELQKLLARAELERASGGDGKLYGAMKQALQLQKQHLLYRYLQAHGQSHALFGPPHDARFHMTDPRAAHVPKAPLPEVLTLKLRVAYDVSDREYLAKGTLGDNSQQLLSVCSEKAAKTKAYAKFCGLLLLGGG